MPATRLDRSLVICSVAVLAVVPLGAADPPQPVPLRQSRLTAAAAGTPQPLSLRDAARDDRWLGLGVRDVRWAIDGGTVYFRWKLDPKPADEPEADPWFRFDTATRTAAPVPEPDVASIPGSSVSWNRRGDKAAWEQAGQVFVHDGATRRVYAGERKAQHVRMRGDGGAVEFMLGEDLYAHDLAGRSLRQLTRRFERKAPKTDAARWLETQQRELFETVRDRERREQERAAAQSRAFGAPQAIPVEAGQKLENIHLSPDGVFVTLIVRTPNAKRAPTKYLDYATRSGYSEPFEAREKVGEPQDELKLGLVRVDPGVAAEDVVVTWAKLGEAGDRRTLPHGPYWSVEGDRAAVQFASGDAKDRWIGLLDLATGAVKVLVHDHDDAWLAGPTALGGFYPEQPVQLDWLPGGSFVFPSERSGWSHLYLTDAATGATQALTSGSWEVREATLSRDRSRWLVTAGREHPCDDHLYGMPARGGAMTRLTDGEGRHTGILSPDGTRLAELRSDSVSLPDLFVRETRMDGSWTRVTQSGTDESLRHALRRPEIVSLPHPDGKPVWAALYEPPKDKRNAAAILHIHGGGYRQFSHRGYSVYGYALHLGLLHYLVEQGYTVLDFDYRGGAGFGRDYRTDIHRSMGDKDVSGGVAAADWLVRERGIDRKRIGIYGLSYGGFFTLMALFKHPGVFAAGIANAPVTDWAHYSHDWTGRILGVPYEDPEAYARSSPINFANGLRDPLLIVHGLIDDNVHFQDSARLVQKLIELEKPFDVMYYPMERHTIQTESTRYDYVRRVAAFLSRHLRGPATAN